jgi:hypothetical protein
LSQAAGPLGALASLSAPPALRGAASAASVPAASAASVPIAGTLGLVRRLELDRLDRRRVGWSQREAHRSDRDGADEKAGSEQPCGAGPHLAALVRAVAGARVAAAGRATAGCAFRETVLMIELRAGHAQAKVGSWREAIMRYA